MAKLKTSEQIKQQLQAFKEKQLQKKEKEKQRKVKIRQEEYKAIDKKLKLERDEAAEKLIKQLQALNPKKEPVKQTIPTNMIGDFYDEELFLTRDELKEWENKHHHCINWEFWDILTTKVKDEIHNMS